MIQFARIKKSIFRWSKFKMHATVYSEDHDRPLVLYSGNGSFLLNRKKPKACPYASIVGFIFTLVGVLGLICLTSVDIYNHYRPQNRVLRSKDSTIVYVSIAFLMSALLTGCIAVVSLVIGIIVSRSPINFRSYLVSRLSMNTFTAIIFLLLTFWSVFTIPQFFVATKLILKTPCEHENAISHNILDLSSWYCFYHKSIYIHSI
jgi:hypothetical protein